MAGGTYFKDLPANMLGCFVIGLFAASTTVGLDTQKPLAALPQVRLPATAPAASARRPPSRSACMLRPPRLRCTAL